MSKSDRKITVRPALAIPGAEIIVECSGFTAENGGCFIGSERSRVTAASQTKIIAIVPENISGETSVRLESGGSEIGSCGITIGSKIAGDMHIVANPAVDPKDDSIIFTRSGSRGQTLPFTLYRLEADGYIDEMPAEIMNPTGIAFSPSGEMFVTNRAEGEVCRIERGEEVSEFAAGLGVATGIAFDANGIMHVGDRSGTIFRVPELGFSEPFAVLEPSVSAYHLAFGPDERLYVSAPGLASFDAIYAIDKEGSVEKYVRGFGRPQGLAFDTDGNLYAAACYQGRHGLVRIDANTKNIEIFAAGNNIVGLCFTRKGEMIIATNDSAYSLPVGIKGLLLN